MAQTTISAATPVKPSSISSAPTNRSTVTMVDKKVEDFLLEVRCVVCAGESLATSQAKLAIDLRRVVIDQFAAGKSVAEVRAYLAARYGDGIFFRPPFKPVTLALWLSPLLLLLAAGAVLFSYFRSSRR